MSFNDTAPNPGRHYIYKGKGRMYFQPYGEEGEIRIGAMEDVEFEVATETEEVNDTEYAAAAVVLTGTTNTTGSVNYTAREMTMENYKTALLGGTISDDDQSATTLDGVEKTLIEGRFIDLGLVDVFSVKLAHGSVTGGPFTVGETVSESGGASGKVAWVGSGFIEVVSVSGSFSAGDALTGASSTATATVSGVTEQDDVVVTNGSDTRYVNGTDYDTDCQYGRVRRIPGGGISAAVTVSADSKAVQRKVMHGMVGGTRSGKLVFVSDRNNKGVRQRVTWHKVEASMNGAIPLIGDDVAGLAISNKVLKDTSQPEGQEYFKVEKFKSAA